MFILFKKKSLTSEQIIKTSKVLICQLNFWLLHKFVLSIKSKIHEHHDLPELKGTFWNSLILFVSTVQNSKVFN